ncbi:MAG: hypothetical protein ABIS15_06775 [Gemmatimonadaceae bacterium]
MRKSYLLIASAGVAFLSACGSGSNTTVNADLQKDLELASSDDGITLGNSAVTSSQQFVSSIESTSPPAREVAKSAPVKRHKPARKSPPKVVQTEVPADVSQSEPTQVASMPVDKIEMDVPVSPRPQPIAVSYPSGESSVGSNGGSGAGAIIGTIFGAVIRGGVVGDDHCDPRRTGRGRGTTISINNQMPFPGRSGLGRVAVGRSGGNVASRFPH